jgi:hypothetical protein
VPVWFGSRHFLPVSARFGHDRQLLETTGSVTALGLSEQLTRLVYELLDAHDDTARIAAALTWDDDWRVHLDDLRDLQRVGRELLAAGGENITAGSVLSP